MRNHSVVLFASLALLGASCVDHEPVSATSDAVGRSATTQSACTVETPTTWVVNGVSCTNPFRWSYPLELGESVRVESFQGGGGYLEISCDAQGLHLVEEVCAGTCELCL